MKKTAIILFLFLLFIFQLTFMPRLAIFGVSPNILLAAILVLAVKSDANFALAAAFLFGLALDFFSSLPFGVWLISFTLAVWLLQAVGKRLFKSLDFFGQAGLIGGALMFFSAFHPFFIKGFAWFGLGPSFSFWPNIFRVSWLEFILNFVAALLLLIMFGQFYGLRRRI